MKAPRLPSCRGKLEKTLSQKWQGKWKEPRIYYFSYYCLPGFWACLLFSLELAHDFWTLGADTTRAGLQWKCLTAAFQLKPLLQPVSRTKQTSLYYFCFTRVYTNEWVCFLMAFFPGCNTQILSLFLHVKCKTPHPTETEVSKSLYNLWTFSLQDAECKQVRFSELRIKLTTLNPENELPRQLLGPSLWDGGSWIPKPFLGVPKHPVAVTYLALHRLGRVPQHELVDESHGTVPSQLGTWLAPPSTHLEMNLYFPTLEHG